MILSSTRFLQIFRQTVDVRLLKQQPHSVYSVDETVLQLTYISGSQNTLLHTAVTEIGMPCQWRIV